MKRFSVQLGIVVLGAMRLSASSIPEQNLVFTEVVEGVRILDVATQKERPAKVGSVLLPMQVVKTEANSRAELVGGDQTVARVGSNTVVSIDPSSHEVSLKQGSVLLHSPTGKGENTIRNGEAKATIRGNTVMVGANKTGGFKAMLLEGKGQITGQDGRSVKLSEGQLSFVLPDQKPSEPLSFALKNQVSSSKLLNGFAKPIASGAKIEGAIAKQESQRSAGKLGDTGLLIGERPETTFKVDAVTVSTATKAISANRDAQKVVTVKLLNSVGKTYGSLGNGLYFRSGSGTLILNNVNPYTKVSTAPTSGVLIVGNDPNKPPTLIFGAITIVLSDPNLNDAVSLRSKAGLVAANPGFGNPVKNGMVNFIRNVFYGNTEVKFQASGDVNNAGFQQAATQAGKNLSGITIGAGAAPSSAPKASH